MAADTRDGIYSSQTGLVTIVLFSLIWLLTAVTSWYLLGMMGGGLQRPCSPFMKGFTHSHCMLNSESLTDVEKYLKDEKVYLEE